MSNSNVVKVKNVLSRFIMVFALVGIILIFTFSTDRFLTLDNMFNVLRQVSTNGIMALGMTLVIINGGIDLSVGSTLAFSGTIACGFIENGMPVFPAVLFGILSGAFFGLINGELVARVKMPPFIVTLATMQMIRGGAYIYSQGSPIRAIEESFNMIGNGYIGIVPVPVIIFVAIAFVLYLMLHRSKFGMYIYAVGGNQNCAIHSGINAKRVTVSVYVISGICAALSGIILSSRMYSGQPTSGSGAELDAIAAAVLGGTSFSGGAGTVWGTIIGILIIGIMNNGLNILNIASYYQLLLKGGIILLAIYIDMLKNKRS